MESPTPHDTFALWQRVKLAVRKGMVYAKRICVDTYDDIA
jgi:hypothetical protein